LMVARCLSRLGRDLEAYEAFRTTEEEARAAPGDRKKYESTAVAAKNEGAETRARLGSVVVAVAGTASVGGRDVGPMQSKPLIVNPGTVVVSFQTAAGTIDEDMEVAPGDEKTITVTPPLPPAAAPVAAGSPPPPPAEPSGINQKTLAYVVGGIGLAGFATFAVFGILNNSKFDDLERSCDADGTCPASLAEDGETGRTYQTVANVGLGVGIVGVAAGVTLFLTAPSSSPERDASRTGPRLAIGPGSVRVDGRF
jgi:hypothetical protein